LLLLLNENSLPPTIREPFELPIPRSDGRRFLANAIGNNMKGSSLLLTVAQKGDDPGGLIPLFGFQRGVTKHSDGR
jgi:hypothetical protein